MSGPYIPHKYTRVNAHSPRAAAICDRCGKRYNHNRLSFQFDYRGPQLQNLQILVCNQCRDRPQDQLRPVILPPDPLPILNPRPDYFDYYEVDYRITQSSDPRITENDDSRVVDESSDETPR